MFTRAAALAASTVYYIELPETIRGITSPDQERGGFVIIINSLLDDTGRRYTLEHELAHIRLNHFYDKTKTDEDKDREADDLAAAEIESTA